MQYPVPQFTDVEDRIIGPLTLKQFGIVFLAGVIIFVGYSATKSILVLIFLAVLFGVPALALAFLPFNGRPIYNTLGNLAKFMSSPKLLIFHKEAQSSNFMKFKDAEVASPVAEQKEINNPADTKANLKEVQKLLRETANKQNDVIRRM
jgi:ABC-type transport system substrate-binding protein